MWGWLAKIPKISRNTELREKFGNSAWKLSLHVVLKPKIVVPSTVTIEATDLQDHISFSVNRSTVHTYCICVYFPFHACVQPFLVLFVLLTVLTFLARSLTFLYQYSFEKRSKKLCHKSKPTNQLQTRNSFFKVQKPLVGVVLCACSISNILVWL